MIFDHVPENRWEVSWVCRGWRDIALSSSSLWATLPKIGFPISSPTNFFESLRIHCARAGSRPLTISKLQLPPAFGFQHSDFLRFLILFRELVPRIGCINVFVDPLWESEDLGLLTIVPQTHAFSSLKSINFTFSPSTDLVDAGTQPPAQGIVIFDSSPALSEMSLSLPRRENWQSVSTWLRVPWTHFKFLELGWVLPSDIYQVLRNAPSLDTLLACVHTVPRADIPQSPRPTEPIKHRNLQSLALLSDQISEIDVALFDLPNARQVYIDSNTTQSDGLHDGAPLAGYSISPILSFQHLTHLFFGPSWKCNGPYLAELLKLTPSLVRLSVSWLDDIAVVFKALCGTPSQESDLEDVEGYFLPSLVSLHICDIPKGVLNPSAIEPWQTEIGKLATRRAAARAKKSGVAPITVTLSPPRKRFHPGSLQTYGKYDFIRLNQALALLESSPSEDAIATATYTTGPISQPLRRLREFLVEYTNHPASGNADDLIYCTWRLDWESRLRDALREITSGAELGRAASFHLPALKTLKGAKIPTELRELMKLFPCNHSETEKVFQHLMDKWKLYATRFRTSPAWILIEDKTKTGCGITYVDRRSKILSPQEVSERLSSCKWGIEVDEESGKIHRLG